MRQRAYTWSQKYLFGVRPIVVYRTARLKLLILMAVAMSCSCCFKWWLHGQLLTIHTACLRAQRHCIKVTKHLSESSHTSPWSKRSSVGESACEHEMPHQVIADLCVGSVTLVLQTPLWCLFQNKLPPFFFFFWQVLYTWITGLFFLCYNEAFLYA